MLVKLAIVGNSFIKNVISKVFSRHGVNFFQTILLGSVYNFPRGSDGRSVCLQCRRRRFNPSVGKILWRRQWHPTLALLPGKSHGQRSLVGCSPWGRRELDTTERPHFHFSLSCMGGGMATHSSVRAWRIPGMGEPGGLPSMGSHRVGHD